MAGRQVPSTATVTVRAEQLPSSRKTNTCLEDTQIFPGVCNYSERLLYADVLFV